MGFRVSNSDKRTPVISIGPEDSTPGEPLFVLTHDDGSLQIVELDLIRDWAQSIYDDDGVEVRDIYREMYIKLPNGKSLLMCAITFDGTEEKPKLVIRGTAAVSGVLWTCDL